MTKVSVDAKGSLVKEENNRDLGLRYFETLKEFNEARESKTVDSRLAIKVADVSNTVFSRNMIDEQQFLEDIALLDVQSHCIVSPEKEAFKQTLADINAVAINVVNAKAKNDKDFTAFWPAPYTAVFNQMTVK